MATINLEIPDFLSTVRLGTFVQTLANKLELNAPLTFLNRTPVVDKLDEMEILSSYSGSIFAADLLTNDAEAVIVESGAMETTATMRDIPIIKIGQSIGQRQLAQLNQLKQQITLDGPNDLITGFELNLARVIVTGVRHRMNQLCAAMMLDGVNYDKMGVMINEGFGTPSGLKQTMLSTRQWTTGNKTTMRPIEDLQFMAQSVAPSYGKNYNRVTMSTAMFQIVSSCDEFAERVRLRFNIIPENFVLNPYDVANNQALFTQITGLQLELEDGTMRTRLSTGAGPSVRYMPDNKVILSNSGDDNDEGAFYFGNTIVEETVVAQFAPNAPQFGGPQVGPVSYYWVDPSLNPPRLNAFAVAKGWPVKVDKYATAILTVY